VSVNEDEWDSSQETDVRLDDLQVDWTERADLDAEGILWLVGNDLPANVSGVDYSRAVSASSSEPSA
jgi:hypothetical protein